ncbi:MAG: hypothetical protein UY63_C0004G0018 [Parcubacteria group bacterium GW2011_GWA2_51_10]|nr:MAG: hypothetical protein UY63_C0004G0018 [Parcubacteria group bacterium GW2011_GWA2_51_10]
MSRMSTLKQYKIALLGIAIVVALFIWWGLRGSPQDVPLLTTEALGGATGIEKELVETLITVQSISLTGTIFSDPAFRSLGDFGREIIPEPMGRRDPFAPLAPGDLDENAESEVPAQLFRAR